MNTKSVLRIAFGIGVAGVLGLIAFFVFGESIQRRIQDQLIQKAVRSLQPDLPFKIEEVSLDGLWSDILQGRAANLTIRLKHELGSVSLSGPMISKRTETDSYRTQYQPKIRVVFAPIGGQKGAEEKLDFEGLIFGDLEIPLTGIEDLGIEIHSKELKLASFGITAKDFNLKTSWRYDEENLSPWDNHIRFSEITWQAGAQTVQLDGLDIHTKGGVDFFPPEVSEKIETKVSAKQIAAVAGDLYFESSLKDFPLGANLNPATQEVEISGPGLRIAARPGAANLNFQVDSLKKTWDWVADSLKNSLPKPKFLKWVVPTGKARVQIQADPTGAKIQLALENFSAGLRALQAAIEGVSVKIPIDIRQEKDGGIRVRATDASLTVKQASFRKASFKIPSWKFGIEAEGKPGKMKGRLTTDRLPEIQSRDFSIKTRKTTLQFETPKFSIRTGLEMEPVPIQKLFDLVCFKGPSASSARFPESEKAWIRFPIIEINQDSVQTEGAIRAELFGGYVNVDKPAVFDWQTEVPESHVDIEWDKIRLEDMGPWMGLGAIQGYLHGCVRNLVMQKTLPTRYDALMEIVPTKGKQIPFSGKAMKTLIYTLTDVDKIGIPSFAKSMAEWVFFGLPNQIAGGYDVNRAGAKARLEEGSIVLETTDPEDDPKTASRGSYDPNRPKLLLDSDMFDFVLKTSRYPAVMDASSFYYMLNFWKERFEAVIGKKPEKVTTDDEEESEDEEAEPDECLPQFFKSSSPSASRSDFRLRDLERLSS